MEKAEKTLFRVKSLRKTNIL